MARQPDQKQVVQYSFAVQTKDSLDISIGGTADYTWNSFGAPLTTRRPWLAASSASFLEAR